MPFPTHHMTIRWGNRQCFSRPRSCLTNINFKINGGQTRLITVDVIRTGTETAGRFASNNRSEIYINSIFYLLIQINSHDSVKQTLATWFICLWLARLAWQLNKQRERTGLSAFTPGANILFFKPFSYPWVRALVLSLTTAPTHYLLINLPNVCNKYIFKAPPTFSFCSSITSAIFPYWCTTSSNQTWAALNLNATTIKSVISQRRLLDRLTNCSRVVKLGFLIITAPPAGQTDKLQVCALTGSHPFEQ